MKKFNERIKLTSSNFKMKLISNVYDVHYSYMINELLNKGFLNGSMINYILLTNFYCKTFKITVHLASNKYFE